MVVFNPEKHEYRVDGVVLPSVTQIIRFLNYDTATTARSWLRDVAASRGSRIHSYCADVDMGAEPDAYDWDCIEYVKAYKAFLRDYRPQWTHIEVATGSKELGYAGTIDRIGVIDGDSIIVDLKSGSTVKHVTLTAQLHGYTYLALINGLVNTTPKRLGVQLKKDGTYRLYWCELDYNLWMACMTLHKKLEKTA
jgi:hypothetical protein